MSNPQLAICRLERQLACKHVCERAQRGARTQALQSAHHGSAQHARTSAVACWQATCQMSSCTLAFLRVAVLRAMASSTPTRVGSSQARA